ncbi:MAG: VOC family protein [Planctomycetota bacterium]|jgi:catechol 2,3-dioxygenase-like lactoylglutathione lyase family enzyme
MENLISQMMGEYESGRVSRRQLVAQLGAMVASAAGVAALSDSAHAAHHGGHTFQGVGLNHLALNVTDVQRSRDFYVKHLGLKVSRESDNNCFLTCGDNFVALFKNAQAGMNHYCYSIQNYDVDEAEKKLKDAGLGEGLRKPSGRIYFRDPDGLVVQLASATHAP